MVRRKYGVVGTFSHLQQQQQQTPTSTTQLPTTTTTADTTPSTYYISSDTAILFNSEKTISDFSQEFEIPSTVQYSSPSSSDESQEYFSDSDFFTMSSTRSSRRRSSGNENHERGKTLATTSPPHRDSLSFLLRLRKTFSLDGLDLSEMKEIVLQKYNEVNMPFSRNRHSRSSNRGQSNSPTGGKRRRSFSTSVVDDFHSRTHRMPFSYQARQENNVIVLKLAKTEQQLHEATERNKYLNEKLVEKGKQLEDARKDIKILQEKLEREIECSGELYHKVKELEQVDGVATITKTQNCAIHLSTDENENKISMKNENLLNESVEMLENHLRKRSITPIGDLMLSCTLCNQRIKIEELQSHSSKCSSGKESKPKNGTYDTPQGMLVATVTYCGREGLTARQQQQQHDEEDGINMYKVICKTTIAAFKKSLLVTERSKEDFLWFRKSLEALHPERVIPPLKFQDDLTGNLREIQRFLSRICAHKVLKTDTLVRKFFEANNKELEKIKKNLENRMPPQLKHRTPSVQAVDKDGLLYKAQVYFNSLQQNLQSLIEFFKTNDTKTADGLSKCFHLISEGEPTDTYLKSITSSLSSIIGGLENKDNVIYDESVLAEDLESISDLVYAAEELLSRVQSAVETFLYWEEEIRVFEEMKTEGLVTATNGRDITHLWAEASSNCRTAKDELEKMCRHLSSELHDFDIRKEQELKQVLIEYAESRFDVFEKMQSKWFGVKLILESEIVPSLRAIDFTNGHSS